MINSTDKKFKKLLILSYIVFVFSVILFIVGIVVLPDLYFNKSKSMTDNEYMNWLLYKILPVAFLSLIIIGLEIGIFLSSLPIFNSVTNFKSTAKKTWTLIAIGVLMILPICSYFTLPLSFIATIIYILILKSKYKKIKYSNVGHIATTGSFMTTKFDSAATNKKIKWFLYINVIFLIIFLINFIAKDIYLSNVSKNSDTWTYSQLIYFYNNELKTTETITGSMHLFYFIVNILMFVILVSPISKNIFTFKSSSRYWTFIIILFILTSVIYMFIGVIFALFLKWKYNRILKTTKIKTKKTEVKMAI